MASSHFHTARLNYGHYKIPGPQEPTFGGLVKLHDLNRAFPHFSTNPNILYLISSALPYFPVRMARMAKRAGAKLVINQNGVAYPGWYGEGWNRANQPMKQLLNMADYVVYQSKFCKVSADKFLGQPDNCPHQVLYNPVDTSNFRPSSRAHSSDNQIVLLLAGSHCSSYRVTVALETLQRVRKKNDRVCLRIAGQICWLDDELEAQREVLDYAKLLGVAEYVDMTGPYTQQQAPKLFNQCSILLHTKYNDPCPRLVVEAMACGVPTVYSATGGVPELVGKEAGVGVSGPLDWNEDHPPNAGDLAVAVEHVIARLEQYSKAARSRAVQKFDTEPWLQQHEEIFQQVLSQTVG